MKVQLLVSALQKDPADLIEEMKIATDAVIVNQCDRNGEEIIHKNGRKIQVLYRMERGVGKSRNEAICHATEDICVFADDDMEYDKGYEAKIINAFVQNPKAEMIVFNVRVGESRKTFENRKSKRVHWYNCGRYGAVSFAIRRESLLKYGVKYSLIFGGGARYCSGEDSLFILDLIKRGCRVYTSPQWIGQERERESTWFRGYNDKYFFDRGVLYTFLYGVMARVFAIRFLLAHKNNMCDELGIWKAYKLMCEGMKEGKRIK